MAESENTVRMVRKEEHEDGSVTAHYEVVAPDGEVLATFTGKAGPSIAERGDEVLEEAGKRMHRLNHIDPRQNPKL